MHLLFALAFVSLSSFSAMPAVDGVYMLAPWDKASTVSIPESGRYTLWLAADPEAGGGLLLNDKKYTVGKGEKDAKGRSAFWRNAGTAALEAGVLKVEWSGGIYLLVLSRDAEYTPERGLSDVRVLPFNRKPEDARLTKERHTDTVFIMPHFDSVEAWEKAAAAIRLRIRLGSGLFPAPEKTPLNAHVFDEKEYDGFSVSKVYFEPVPGFLATGNLYRPLGEGPFPAVVSPHGHWTAGRLENTDLGSIAGRCITLARMGIVTLSYDMIGYVDSIQLPHRWGTEAEKLWGIHPFAMQLWTSLRAVDFMEALPYVDPERLGCTGASGGGTQTFALTALEPRIRVSAPVNMISSTMQGGCLCENAPLLRLTNSNMEIGALAAPHPLLMVSTTGDWTRETPRVEYPAVRSIYALYGAEDQVVNVHLDFPHNYNRQSREAMYRFFGAHLLGGDWHAYEEPPFEMPQEEALRVFPGDRLPEGYLAGEALRAQLMNQAQERRAHHLEQALKAPDSFAEDYHEALTALFAAELPGKNALSLERLEMEEREGYVLERWLIGRISEGDRVPLLLYRGTGALPQESILLVHGAGKAAFADLQHGGPGSLIRRLLAEGKMVATLDAFLIGEYNGPERAAKRVEKGKFSDPFLPAVASCRVQDILTAAAFLRSRFDTAGRIDLVGVEEGGLWCLFAGAVDRSLHSVYVDLNRQNYSDDSLWESRFFVPGIRSFGDIPAACVAGGFSRFHFFNGSLPPELAHSGISVEADDPSDETLAAWLVGK